MARLSAFPLPDIPAKPAPIETSVAISPRSVMAPALALAESVGPALRDMARPIRAFADQIQEAENWQTVIEKRAEMRREYADFQNLVAADKSIDPAKHLELWRAKAREVRGRLLDDGMPLSVRQRIEGELTDWTSRSEVEVARDATLIRLDRINRTFENELTGFISENRFDEADGLVDGAGTFLDPPQQEKLHQEIDRRRKEKETYDAIARDPTGHRTAHPVPGPNEDYGQWATYDTAARQFENRRATDKANDIIGRVWSTDPARRITSLEQVDKETEGMPDDERRQIHDAAARQFSENYREWQSKPKNIDRVTGQVSAIIADLDPASDEFRREAIRARGLLYGLPEGLPSRRVLERQLSELEAGQRTYATNAAERAREELNAIFKRDIFGPLTKRMTLGQALDDRLLGDTAKLVAYGIPPETAEEIAELARPSRGYPLGKQKEAVEAFRAAVAGGPPNKNVADPFTTAALNAVRASRERSTEIEWTDPLQMRAAEGRYGAALAAFDAWMAKHPGDVDDPAKVMEFIQRTLSPAAAGEVAQPLIEEAPLEGGDPGEETPWQDPEFGVPGWGAPASDDLLPPLND